MLKVYGIKHRSYIIDKVRREGYLAFRGPDLKHRGFYGDLFDEALFSLNCDHILGTQSQYDSGLATCYYDGTVFKGFTSSTKRTGSGITNPPVEINFEDYDRIIIIIEALDRSIVFPDKFLILTNHNELDQNGFDMTIPGRVDGELNLTGTASGLNLSGQVEALIVNWSLVTINFTGSGSYFSNGTLTT